MPPRILVVEDDRYFAGILQDYLRYIGFTVTLSGDGRAALESFHQAAPDVVLTDILLPRLNGVELAARIRASAEGASIPVILMSAVYRSEDTIRRDLRQSAANGYLVKPFAMVELRRMLAEILPEQQLSEASQDEDDYTDPKLHVTRYRPDSILPTEGTVSTGCVGSLLLQLRMARHTGVLTFQDGARWKEIVLLNGLAVWSDSSDQQDRLGAMLLEEGLIEQDQYQRAVAAMKERGLDFGLAITELHILTPTELYRQLRRLVHRRIVSAFGWSVGSWTLTDHFPRQTSSFEINTLAVVWDGLRAHGDTERLRKDLQPSWDRYVLRTSRFQDEWNELKSVDGVGSLASFISGRKTPAQLEEMEILAPPDFVRALWLLFRAGLVGLAEKPSEKKPEPVTETGEWSLLGPGTGETEFCEQVIRDYLRLWQADFYSMFAIELGDDQQTVDAALTKAIIPYDPDNLPVMLPPDIRSKAMALCARLDEARSVLRDPKLRADYSSRLRDGMTGIYAKITRPETDEASMYFDLGKANIQARDFREAESWFAKAADGDPGSAEYLAYQGWASYRSARGNEGGVREAVQLLRRALQVDPHLPIGLYFLGMAQRDRRQYNEAIQSLEAAVRFDPKFEVARKALDETCDLAGRPRPAEPRLR